MKVSELLDVESRQWDRGKIETLFAPRTRQEILAIPLDHLNSPTCWFWQKMQLRNSLSKLLIDLHSIWISNHGQNTFKAVPISLFGEESRHSTYHPKSERFYGELAQIVFQPGKISKNAEFKWILDVISVITGSRIQATSYGNAYLHKMCGHWWVAESRNAETWPTTSSNYSDRSVTNLPNENLSSGQLQRGRFGMQETSSTLSMSNSNQKQLLMLLADYWRSTNASWLCSKKPLFSSVFLLHICIGLMLKCCINFYFFKNPDTVHWGSLCIVLNFTH